MSEEADESAEAPEETPEEASEVAASEAAPSEVEVAAAATAVASKASGVASTAAAPSAAASTAAPPPAAAEPPPVAGISTEKFLLSRSIRRPSDGHTVKVVVVGAGPVGVAVAFEILIKRIAAELVIFDEDEDFAKAEAEDLAHAAVVLGGTKVYGTKEFCEARDATVCVLAGCHRGSRGLDDSVGRLKALLPEVSRYAPSSVLVVAESPVDVLSYAAMKLSGFHPGRVIGVGTLLDACRLRHLVAEKLGIAAGSVQSLVIAESGPTSVPIWSTVSVMGMRLKDINKDIGSPKDPESWAEEHRRAADSSAELIRRKGQHCWAVAACTCEIVNAVVRDACACMTVSTFVKGCRHGLEKDVFMSLPCIVGRDGVLSYVRHLYTPEEQELTTRSSRSIYEAQKAILDSLC